jgi:integrase/recombinase XerD
MSRSLLPSLVQQFFTDRLCTQLNASPNTIAGYRDTFRLLLRYASEKTGRPPTKLAVEDFDVELIADFLSDIETRRGNGVKRRPIGTPRIASSANVTLITKPVLTIRRRPIG